MTNPENDFQLSLSRMQCFCSKADIAEFPSIKIHFKTSREYSRFKMQLENELIFTMASCNLEKFQMMGFDIELICDWKTI